MEKCHKIPLVEEFNIFVLPDSTKEPAQLIKLPLLVAAVDTGTRKKRASSRKAQVIPPRTIYS